MKFTSRIIALTRFALCATAASVGIAQAQVLRFSAVPEEPIAVMQARFAPLLKYLETRGLTAVWVPMPDMASFVDAMAAKRVDFVWTNGFGYVQARKLMNGNLTPIAQRAEDSQFQSVFVTHDPEIRALADFADKTLVFGPRNSVSGHLMPRYFLSTQSPGTTEKIKAIKHAISHEAAITQIVAKQADIAAVNLAAWDRMNAEGKIDASTVRVMHTTPTFFDYCFAVPGDRDPALVTALQNALIGLDPRRSEHQPILRALRAARIITSTEENYTLLEAAAKQAGILR